MCMGDPRDDEGFEEKIPPPTVLLQLQGRSPGTSRKKLSFGGLDQIPLPQPQP